MSTEPRSKRMKGETRVIDMRQEIEDKMWASFSDKTTCDVVLVVEGHRFPVHRCYLSIQSNYFKDLFSRTWSSSRDTNEGKEIELKGVKPMPFKHLLNALYSMEVRVDLLDDNLLMDLLILSNQLMFNCLSSKLLDYVEEIISRSRDYFSVDTVLRWFTIFKSLGSSRLEAKTRHFVEKHSERVILNESFSSLPFSSLRDILSSNTFFANELNIFWAVHEWLQVNRNNGVNVNPKEAYSLVRFNCISCEGFICDVLPIITPLNIDVLHSPETTSRSSISFDPSNETRLKLTADNFVRYSGPKVDKLTTHFEGDSFCVSVKFDKLYALSMVVLTVSPLDLKLFPLSVHFVDYSLGKRLSTVAQISKMLLPNTEPKTFTFFLQQPVSAKKCTLQFNSEAAQMISKLDITLRLLHSRDTSLNGWTYPCLKSANNMFNNVIERLDLEKNVWLVGLMTKSLVNEKTSEHLRHPIPNTRGITFVYIQTFDVNSIYLEVNDEEGVKFDVHILAGKSCEELTSVGFLTKFSGSTRVTFSKRRMSVVCVLGTKAYDLNVTQLKLNDLSIQLIED